MKLPLLSELEVEQLDVYTHPANKSVIVVGPPGSGKTSLAIWRALFVARQGQNVVLITRNRMLAAMARQLASEGEGGSFVTTTMQSFVWQDCIEAIKEPPNGGNGDYTIDWPKISKKFRAQGVKRRIDHLIVDEGQNLPAGFFLWANEFCSPTMSIFADEHQTTVNEGSTMQDLRKLGIPDWLRLMFNHRNTEEIARLSGWFHKDRMLPQTIARRGSSGDVPRVIEVVGSAWDDLAQMAADRLSNVGGSIGIITYEQNDVEAIYAAIRNVAPGLRVDRYHSPRARMTCITSLSQFSE